MSDHIEAYPLQWPDGRPRARWRKSSGFNTTLGKARDHLMNEIRLLGGKLPVLSSNLSLRRDGLPYASQSQPSDPGIAVYFTYKGKQHCFACDDWDRIQDNIRAVGKTIEALRGIARWGTGDMMERAFQGFVALPQPEQWFTVLGVSSRASKDEIESAYRLLAMKHHPDRGGDASEMARINAARDQAYERAEP